MATAVAEASLTLPKEKKRRRSHGDRIYYVLIKAIVGVVLAIFAGVFIVVVTGAWPAMKRFGPGFLIHTGWDPVHLVFGALPFYCRHGPCSVRRNGRLPEVSV